MAWLTVREAAEALEISEEAVRKRMQRNTLKHDKWTDGRAYVYMPAKQDAEKDAPAQPPGNSDQKQPHSWLEYVAAGTGVIALVGGLTYALGLLAVWIPIWWTHTDDATAAWYAASLVPKTVVAGLGLGKLVAYPMLTVIVGLTGFILFNLLAVSARERWGLTGLGGVTALLYLVLTGMIIRTLVTTFDLSLRTAVVVGAAVSFAILAAAVVAALVTRYFLSRQRRRNRAGTMDEPDERDTTEALHRGDVTDTGKNGDAPEAASDDYSRWSRLSPMGARPPWWRWWFAPVFLFASAYIAAGANICTCPPPLPAVEITGVKDMKGDLLTHTDGFWYVFDVAGRNKGELIALRDDQVETVALTSEGKSSDGKEHTLTPSSELPRTPESGSPTSEDAHSTHYGE